MAANGITNGTPALPKADGDGEKIIDYLIVGTGPAGGSLGCFLAQNGMNVVQMSSRRRLTSMQE
ncbi:hypothetical protein LTR95_011239 [Oleoguttula sp. CCFEE 5521]